MKCLENLSLVEDEYVEELKNEIEQIINSYIDVEKKTIETFKEIRKMAYGLHSYEINRILKIFVDSDTFFGMPINITGSGWEENMLNFFNFDHPNDQKYIMKEIIWLLETTSRDIGKKIDVENNSYWLYRDGSNWELWFEEEETFLDMLEKQIEYETKETQFKLLKVFLDIKKQKKCHK